MHSNTLLPAVIFDRDGVLNKTLVVQGKPYAPREFKDFHIFPEAEIVIREIKKAGYLTFVATNQPDVGNGLVKREIVEKMHKLLNKTLVLDGIKVCYHSQGAGCPCRKPKPGMLLEVATEHSVDLKRSFMIGDRVGDIEAGLIAGCKTIFIDYDYAEGKPQNAHYIVRSLQEASNIILQHKIL